MISYQTDNKNDSVLVLSSKGGWKPVVTIGSSGNHEVVACFEKDSSTIAFHSCSLSWKNQLHIFGGNPEKRQISRLRGYKLERIGDLSFDHYHGACSSVANEIYLCFDLNDGKVCHKSTGPLETFSEITPSKFNHKFISNSNSNSTSQCL